MVLELAAVRDARPVPALRTLLLGPAAQRLPERVEAAVRREQAQGEVIVTLIQALAIVLFGVLYTLTPKAFPPNVPFEPVPLALAVYALFTAARLALALRGRLREWFLALSVVADVVLLMVTIWSFHLQYGAPPAIYLKAPTLMYVFILIALRTLRFEPGYVLLCGAAAALGWLLLVAYALLDDPRRDGHAQLRRLRHVLQRPGRGRGRQGGLDPGGDADPGAGAAPGAGTPGAGVARAAGGRRPLALLRAGDRRAGSPGPRWTSSRARRSCARRRC